MPHVAIVHRRYIEPILAGTKTIEMRLGRTRAAPFGVVEVGDRVYFKAASGAFAATAIVSRVRFLESLTPRRVTSIERRYGKWIQGDRAYWQTKRTARHGTLIWLCEAEPIVFGPDLDVYRTRGSRMAWFVLPPEAEVYPECVDRSLLFTSGSRSCRTGQRLQDVRRLSVRRSRRGPNRQRA